jgi:hypothetical protein
MEGGPFGSVAKNQITTIKKSPSYGNRSGTIQTSKHKTMKNLFKSLAEFQQEVPTIHKGTQGYGYSYADLPAIFEVINPLLKKNGLGFTQLIQAAQIETIIFHIESGEQIKSLMDIPQGVDLKGMNQFQVLGSAITYLSRYALPAALGLVTDKDTDAAGEQVKSEAKKETPKDDKPWMNDTELALWKELVIVGKTQEAKKFADQFKKSKATQDRMAAIYNELKTANA